MKMALKQSENLLSNDIIEYSEEIIEELFGAKLPANWNDLKRDEKSELTYRWVRDAFPNVPESLVPITAGLSVDGDSGNSMEEKPVWLDREKLARGQKFAQDNIFGIYFSVLLTLFGSVSFDEGLKPIIATRKSSEPYTAFKRYLSTSVRIRNWYTTDPWTKGTPAYNDMKAVRRIHTIIRHKINAMSDEEMTKAATIENPLSPTRNIILQDFRSTCPVTLPGQCPFAVKSQGPVKLKRMHQCEMAVVQGGFVCLVILYPQAIGIHGATDEQLDDFCYVWRCIGYLLGIEDEFNFCRGSFDDIKQRSVDFLNLWIKANFRDITPEFEHMLRCLIAGSSYYLADISYEESLLYLTELMDLDMPRLRSALSNGDWIKHKFMKFMMQYAMRVPQIKIFLNAQINKSMNDALKFTDVEHTKLQKKSSQLLLSNTSKNKSRNIFNHYKIFETSLIVILLSFVFKFVLNEV
ncbi:uncharacterized protein LOC130677222 [Microplitis mediator]|uniref:uncharacterized protein LOC130677222 n=1 Tax=Microplitis mediator TaxID=375433 RepID=UPI002555D204|nr:uncharacterized protein LOC130677222 [Microplitis mediator]